MWHIYTFWIWGPVFFVWHIRCYCYQYHNTALKIIFTILHELVYRLFDYSNQNEESLYLLTGKIMVRCSAGLLYTSSRCGAGYTSRGVRSFELWRSRVDNLRNQCEVSAFGWAVLQEAAISSTTEADNRTGTFLTALLYSKYLGLCFLSVLFFFPFG